MADITPDLAVRIQSAAAAMIAESHNREWDYLQLVNAIRNRFRLSPSLARRVVSIMCDRMEHGWSPCEEGKRECVTFYDLK